MCDASIGSEVLTDDCFVRVIPKPESVERRPIILFRTLTRTRQATDAVYRCQARRLIGLCDHSVEMLLDVRGCFDNVDRKKLQELAIVAGYPPLALYFSSIINSFRRRLLWDGDIV